MRNLTTSAKKIRLATPGLFEFLAQLAEKGVNVKEVYDEMEWWFEKFTEDDRIRLKLPQAQLCSASTYKRMQAQMIDLGFELEDAEDSTLESD